MARIVVTLSASTDQTIILSDLQARAGLPTAVRFRALFAALHDRLADHPASGPRRPALGPVVRIGIVSPYIVIYEYRASEDIVTVLRIVHGRRNMTADLLVGPR